MGKRDRIPNRLVPFHVLSRELQNSLAGSLPSSSSPSTAAVRYPRYFRQVTLYAGTSIRGVLVASSKYATPFRKWCDARIWGDICQDCRCRVVWVEDTWFSSYECRCRRVTAISLVMRPNTLHSASTWKDMNSKHQ